jgi:hypothetical protein
MLGTGSTTTVPDPDNSTVSVYEPIPGSSRTPAGEEQINLQHVRRLIVNSNHQTGIVSLNTPTVFCLKKLLIQNCFVEYYYCIQIKKL